MSFRFLRRASWLLLLGATACAADGVEDAAPLAQQAAPEPRLQPALVFQTFGEILPLSGGVEGDFPARFRLTQLPPPPADQLHASGRIERGQPVPSSLIASVAAVEVGRIPRTFPERLRWDWTCGDTREEGCTGKAKVCGFDPLDCTKVTIHCDIEDTNCTLTGLSGNLTSLRSAVRQLEARVTDHFLLYVAADAPADTLLSRSYADGAPLHAGWHLAKPRTVVPREPAARDRCNAEAQRALIAGYERELGRSFASEGDIYEYLMVSRYNAKRGTQHERFGEIDPDDRELDTIYDQVVLEMEVRFDSAQIEQHCDEPAAYVVVGDLASRELSMTLAAPLPQVGASFPNGPPFDGSKAPLDWPWF